jgi:hypothetical protein
MKSNEEIVHLLAPTNINPKEEIHKKLLYRISSLFHQCAKLEKSIKDSSLLTKDKWNSRLKTQYATLQTLKLELYQLLPTEKEEEPEGHYDINTASITKTPPAATLSDVQKRWAKEAYEYYGFLNWLNTRMLTSLGLPTENRSPAEIFAQTGKHASTTFGGRFSEFYENSNWAFLLRVGAFFPTLIYKGARWLSSTAPEKKLDLALNEASKEINFLEEDFQHVHLQKVKTEDEKSHLISRAPKVLDEKLTAEMETIAKHLENLDASIITIQNHIESLGQKFKSTKISKSKYDYLKKQLSFRLDGFKECHEILKNKFELLKKNREKTTQTLHQWLQDASESDIPNTKEVLEYMGFLFKKEQSFLLNLTKEAEETYFSEIPYQKEKKTPFSEIPFFSELEALEIPRINDLPSEKNKSQNSLLVENEERKDEDLNSLLDDNHEDKKGDENPNSLLDDNHEDKKDDENPNSLLDDNHEDKKDDENPNSLLDDNHEDKQDDEILNSLLDDKSLNNISKKTVKDMTIIGFHAESESPRGTSKNRQQEELTEKTLDNSLLNNSGL